MRLNKKKLLFATAMTMLAIITSEKVNAESLNEGNKSSQIEIEILARPVGLTSVSPPEFGTYTLTESSQTIEALSDLIINIEDNREDGVNSWGLNYSISLFESSLGTVQDIVLKIGKGELLSENSVVNKDLYKVNQNDIFTEEQVNLIEMPISYKANYTYRVPKEEIKLNLPSNMNAGVYEATQTIQLVNLPEVN